MNDQQPNVNSAPASSAQFVTRPAWRLEPDIDDERQRFLKHRLTLLPDVQQGVYPFKDVRLTRADIEWLLITHQQGHLSPREALIFSVTSFHGRGFFPGPFTLGDNVTALAALEAVVGLLIEISFIATFTQRFFGR